MKSKAIRLAFSVALLAAFTFPANADEKSRILAFDSEQYKHKCDDNNRKNQFWYCYRRLNSKIKRVTVHARQYSFDKLLEKSKFRNSNITFGGRYAVEAMFLLMSASNAYNQMIEHDCQLAVWEVKGGTWAMIAELPCEIEHRKRLLGRYKSLLQHHDF